MTHNNPALTKLEGYPDPARSILLNIRLWIFEIAKQDDLSGVTETFKWGEPSYLVKQGSTVRIDYKANQPEYVSIYFNCKTRLIDTFKELYPTDFEYQNTRELLIKIDLPIPEYQIKHCLALALNYHKIKHLALLGA
jgi:hypothetical protein